jgi:hypothetical protein
MLYIIKGKEYFISNLTFTLEKLNERIFWRIKEYDNIKLR